MSQSSKKTNGITIATAVDAKFFALIIGFEQNIFQVFGSYPIVADIGLNDDQKPLIKSQISTHSVDSGFSDHSSDGFIRAIHKPQIVREILKQIDSPLLLLDTDMVITSAFDFSIFDGCDMAITRRHRRERRDKKNLLNGNLNTGFLFFRNTSAVFALIDQWEALCSSTDKSDQRALSDLLEHFDITGDFGIRSHDGLDLKILEPNLYNDVASKTGYIYHIKAGGRSKKRAGRWQRYNWLARNIPWLLKLRVAFWRKMPFEA